MPTTIDSAPAGELPDGRTVTRWTLRGRTLSLAVLDLGATVQSLRVGDADVVLGFDDLALYLRRPGPYLGATIGRYANRIGGARYRLDGREVSLEPNEGANALHGGPHGWDLRTWAAEAAGPDAVRFSLSSPDGDQGQPGAVRASVTYALLDDAVRIDYAAQTDAPTVVNLTNHTYFNLDGAASGSTAGHRLSVAASRSVAVDGGLIPTGELAPVDGGRLDFRSGPPVGEAPVDACLVLDERGDAVAARLTGAGGRVLEVTTTEPGLQVYNGVHLDRTLAGKDGRRYGPGDGIALETQRLPDAPNHPGFGPAALAPGETFAASTLWRFPAG